MSLLAAVRRLLTGWDRVDFAMDRQERKFWCWAACSSAVAGHYDRQSPWTQCRVAEAVLDDDSCCGGAAHCNRVESLTDALTHTGNLNAVRPTAASYGDLRSQLRRGRPVAARIAWRTGGPAHFLVVTACTVRGEQCVRIHDPAHGSSRDSPFDVAVHRYKHTGAWTHTYDTRAA